MRPETVMLLDVCFERMADTDISKMDALRSGVQYKEEHLLNLMVSWLTAQLWKERMVN